MNAPLRPQAEPPVWDLSDLYGGPDDPAVARDLEAGRALVADLAKMEGGFVAARAEPARLGEAIDRAVTLYEHITERLGGIAAFASMAATVAREDAGLAKFEADVRAKVSAISADTLFLTLELNQLEEAELEAALAAVPAAARWRPWLRRVRLNRPHELSAELERMLVDRAPAVAQWTRLFDETLARMRVPVGRETLTLNEALTRQSDPDPMKRRAAADGLAEALAQATPVLALSLNTVAEEKRVEDRWRRFADPAAPRHLANEVDAEAVDAMAEAVAEAYPRLSHRYYALKARVMGKKTLDYWDRNAPLEKAAPRSYGWDEARGVVLDAFGRLGPEFADRASTFFERPWIDARPRPGKTSGAYAHPVTADRHPYVFMNFMGERRDVLTLAHELGHAVHQTLAQPLGTLLADTPLTLAETASIFAEGLVFEKLLGEAGPAEQRALLAGRIEDGLNTVVRQIAFHRFEARFHAARQEGEVSAEQIGKLWLEVMGESLGPAVTLNAGYEHYWAYVSHFVHAPFYVYAYAFGDLLVSALMEKRRQDPAGFAPLYEGLLAGGGAKTYVEALAPFGLDPRQKAFWQAGCARLEGLIDRFEQLV
ncbi:M3 family oligoendopeptidase [Caulobacter sp. 17J65-9]|uniref:M3 family oligoendopeptidase n=1 Tax=Caulobacter sp. 17J65-9 TaxID=2709382 RepID=UPI0013CC8048|nr:M3 family oligoendopeptidase [Caulobacter sp. 17J65-9]NEX93322.1 M3 family oligoendopeptidase [Caulobacter sp. 17J65-9]